MKVKLIILLVLMLLPMAAASDKTTTYDHMTLLFENSTPKMRFYDFERGDTYNYFLFQVFNVYEVDAEGEYIDPRMESIVSGPDYHNTGFSNITDGQEIGFSADIEFWTKIFKYRVNVKIEKASIPTIIDNDQFNTPTIKITYSIRFWNWDFLNESNTLMLNMKFYSSDFSTDRDYVEDTPYFMLEKTDMMAIAKFSDYVHNGSNRAITGDDIVVNADKEVLGEFDVMWYDFQVGFPANTKEMGLDVELYVRNDPNIDESVNRPQPFPITGLILGLVTYSVIQKNRKNK
ncbi:MAG: hypothetical protein INQ03_03780 [Candidatus Heimdallarchaeota archaeon]|nr:hypothetical protein [Candidatus Heimdallarchaeota archaeon]